MLAAVFLLGMKSVTVCAVLDTGESSCVTKTFITVSLGGTSLTAPDDGGGGGGSTTGNGDPQVEARCSATDGAIDQSAEGGVAEQLREKTAADGNEWGMFAVRDMKTGSIRWYGPYSDGSSVSVDQTGAIERFGVNPLDVVAFAHSHPDDNGALSQSDRDNVTRYGNYLRENQRAMNKSLFRSYVITKNSVTKKAYLSKGACSSF
jgi:hypothetical protein